MLTYFIIPHGTRLRDAATERVREPYSLFTHALLHFQTSVVYVKTPAGREQEQETITQQLIDAFKDARFEIVDKEGRGMQYVVFKKSACVRYLLAYTKNGALFDLVTSGYVCAIPITGQSGPASNGPECFEACVRFRAFRPAAVHASGARHRQRSRTVPFGSPARLRRGLVLDLKGLHCREGSGARHRGRRTRYGCRQPGRGERRLQDHLRTRQVRGGDVGRSLCRLLTAARVRSNKAC